MVILFGSRERIISNSASLWHLRNRFIHPTARAGGTKPAGGHEFLVIREVFNERGERRKIFYFQSVES